MCAHTHNLAFIVGVTLCTLFDDSFLNNKVKCSGITGFLMFAEDSKFVKSLENIELDQQGAKKEKLDGGIEIICI